MHLSILCVFLMEMNIRFGSYDLWMRLSANELFHSIFFFVVSIFHSCNKLILKQSRFVRILTKTGNCDEIALMNYWSLCVEVSTEWIFSLKLHLLRYFFFIKMSIDILFELRVQMMNWINDHRSKILSFIFSI